MKLLDNFRKVWHFQQSAGHILPPTGMLGISYQPDWLDVLGICLIFLPIVLLALAMR